MQTSQPVQSGKGFRGQVKMFCKLDCTKTVSTFAEAKHVIDIKKIEMSPGYFRAVLFEYCMHKPAEFADHYSSVETLLARAPLYVKKVQKKQAKRISKNEYFTYNTLASAYAAITPEMAATIKQIFENGAEPFDEF
jgi:hypothetical protein